MDKTPLTDFEEFAEGLKLTPWQRKAMARLLNDPKMNFTDRKVIEMRLAGISRVVYLPKERE